MCPPDMYGLGNSTGKAHSALIPLFVTESTTSGRDFYVEQGSTTRSWAHGDALMRLYMRVVHAFFCENGCHFAATQEQFHISLATAVGRLLENHGVIADAGPVQVELQSLNEMATHPSFPKLGRYLFASNSRTKAQRAETLWGYHGEAPGLMDVLESDVLDAVGVRKA